MYSEKIGKAMVEELKHLQGDLPIFNTSDLTSPHDYYTPTWPHLETLAITSRDMCPPRSMSGGADGSKALIDALLIAAAKAALAMQKLKTVEIWNGGKGFACIFRYSRAGGQAGQRPTISLDVSWGYRILPGKEVYRAWEAVAKAHDCTDRGIDLQQTSLHPGLFKTHGSVMGILELKRLVAHPVSLAQLEWEVENGAWAAVKD